MPGLNYEAFMFSILEELSVDEIESKYKILKNRILKVSVASVTLSIAPVFGMDIVLNIALICKELLSYHKTFEAMHTFVKIELEKLKTSEARLGESPSDLISPFTESVVLEWLASGDTLSLLIQVLNGCRDDAILVYSHDEFLSKFYFHYLQEPHHWCNC